MDKQIGNDPLDVADAGIAMLFRVAWKEKLLIAVTVLFGTVLSLAYVLLADEWFESEILLAPVVEQSGPQLPSDLGSIASLVGMDLGGSNVQESRAVLQSRDLAREFIQDNQLLPIFYSDVWSEEDHQWLVSDEDEIPDIRDGIKYFAENVLSIRDAGGSDLLSLVIRWKDPELAALWATELVDRVNFEMRTRALEEAETSVKYLTKKLLDTSHVATQQAISNVLERELQRYVLAEGNTQFAFRIVDSAQVPKYPKYPQKALIVATTILFSAVIGLLVAYSRYLSVSTKASEKSSNGGRSERRP